MSDSVDPSLEFRAEPESSNLLDSFANNVDRRGWYIGPSKIQGKGLIAAADFYEGDDIALAISGYESRWDGGKNWILTPAGRYTNHQNKPNAQLNKNGDSFTIVADADIKKGDEITVDYRQVTRVIGRNAGMIYGEEQMPVSDLEGWVEL